MSNYGIGQPQLLDIRDRNGSISRGANQLWYGDSWQRRAGCGPTNCATLVWYLSQTRPHLAPLCPHDGSKQDGFLSLMEDIWEYVTPGMRGLNKPDMMTGGVKKYAQGFGIELETNTLPVPTIIGERPSRDSLLQFLLNAFSGDLPIAFLNLSRGSLRNLDSWHWVTLIDVDDNTLLATMLDAGRTTSIDLGAWLKSTTLGGGFVTIVG